MPVDHAFGIGHLWARSDLVQQVVVAILLLMSVATWYLILGKCWQVLRLRRSHGAIDEFWSAQSLSDAVLTLQMHAPDSPMSVLAAQAERAAAHHDRHLRDPSWSLGGALDRSEFLTRALRQAIVRSTARLEAGLTVLASVGATAPFVGLFGTVWGIYHALAAIGVSGLATLDKVAGPVGEALIMTALGLAVAIPAVLAYNALTRANRVILAELDGFAHDLHAYLTTGARIPPAAGAALQRSDRAAASAPTRVKAAGVA